MASLILLLMFAIFLAFVLFIFKMTRLKKKRAIQIQLFGIQFTLVGGILAVDPNSSLQGFEYVVVLLGLVLGIVGFVADEKET